MTPAGRTNITDSLKLAYQELTGPARRPNARQIVMVMTDGAPNELNCEIPKYGLNNGILTANNLCEQTALYRADQIKQAGGFVYTV
jgi:Mg-chelatase subunit ChlD